MGKERQPTRMVTSLDLGTFAAPKKNSWNLPDAEEETTKRRMLRGCPGPLPDAAKFGMYQDLGLSDKGLDKTIRRFVSYWAEGAAKTHGPWVYKQSSPQLEVCSGEVSESLCVISGASASGLARTCTS